MLFLTSKTQNTYVNWTGYTIYLHLGTETEHKHVPTVLTSDFVCSKSGDFETCNALVLFLPFPMLCRTSNNFDNLRTLLPTRLAYQFYSMYIFQVYLILSCHQH